MSREWKAKTEKEIFKDFKNKVGIKYLKIPKGIYEGDRLNEFPRSAFENSVLTANYPQASEILEKYRDSSPDPQPFNFIKLFFYFSVLYEIIEEIRKTEGEKLQQQVAENFNPIFKKFEIALNKLNLPNIDNKSKKTEIKETKSKGKKPLQTILIKTVHSYIKMPIGSNIEIILAKLIKYFESKYLNKSVVIQYNPDKEQEILERLHQNLNLVTKFLWLRNNLKATEEYHNQYVLIEKYIKQFENLYFKGKDKHFSAIVGRLYIVAALFLLRASMGHNISCLQGHLFSEDNLMLFGLAEELFFKAWLSSDPNTTQAYNNLEKAANLLGLVDAAERLNNLPQTYKILLKWQDNKEIYDAVIWKNEQAKQDYEKEFPLFSEIFKIQKLEVEISHQFQIKNIFIKACMQKWSAQKLLQQLLEANIFSGENKIELESRIALLTPALAVTALPPLQTESSKMELSPDEKISQPKANSNEVSTASSVTTLTARREASKKKGKLEATKKDKDEKDKENPMKKLKNAKEEKNAEISKPWQKKGPALFNPNTTQNSMLVDKKLTSAGSSNEKSKKLG